MFHLKKCKLKISKLQQSKKYNKNVFIYTYSNIYKKFNNISKINLDLKNYMGYNR